MCSTTLRSLPVVTDYATPEEAALSGFSPGAEARVVSVEMIDEWHAKVVVETVPSHPITSDVRRDRSGRWTEWSSAG
jgi:hypothetical protein